jgi:uncharacterized protein
MKIDPFEFARTGERASGELPLSSMSRIEMPTRDGALHWTARGSMNGRHGAPRLDLDADGSVTLTCQRCLQPMQQPVAIHARFLVAADEDAADALDQDDDYDVVVGLPGLDLDQLIEDEVILALPSAPRHQVCPDGATDASAVVSKPSPFAALAALTTVRTTAVPPGDADDDGDA